MKGRNRVSFGALNDLREIAIQQSLHGLFGGSFLSGGTPFFSAIINFCAIRTRKMRLNGELFVAFAQKNFLIINSVWLKITYNVKM